MKKGGGPRKGTKRHERNSRNRDKLKKYFFNCVYVFYFFVSFRPLSWSPSSKPLGDRLDQRDRERDPASQEPGQEHQHGDPHGEEPGDEGDHGLVQLGEGLDDPDEQPDHQGGQERRSAQDQGEPQRLTRP